MKKIFISSALALLILASCNKDKEILNTLNDYNIGKQDQGYHFGDKIQIPEDVMDYAEAITITYNDKETDKLTIDPSFFSLGENDITFNIKTKSGGEIYKQTMEQADRLEITLVDADPDADTFFPAIDPKIWQKTDEECFEKDEKNEYSFCFQTFERLIKS